MPNDDLITSDLIALLRAVLPQLTEQRLLSGSTATHAELRGLMHDGDMQRILRHGLQAEGRFIAPILTTTSASA